MKIKAQHSALSKAIIKNKDLNRKILISDVSS